jgi:hypothetical protein
MTSLRTFRYRLSLTPLRRPITWAHHRGLRASDVFLASYPRSGNTWLRFLLAECLTTTESGFDNINALIPEIGMHEHAVELLSDKGRLIKTHEVYRREYRKAIYLVRDVRDVLLSNYNRAKELGLVNGMDLESFVPLFVEGSLARVGTWQNHVRVWLESGSRSCGSFLLIRFEDLKADTSATLAKIVRFLGITLDSARIAHAMANNSLSQMRSKEDNSRSLHKSSKEAGRFVGKGSVAGWREKLSESQVQLIESYTAGELTRLGYRFGSGVRSPVAKTRPGNN